MEQSSPWKSDISKDSQTILAKYEKINMNN